jgi:alpha-tubulin suppressor-like RCC1 family protein
VGSTTAVDVIGIASAAALATGYGHTCAIVAGSVRCWGLNFYGQLGDGTTTYASTPVVASGVSGATSVAAGSDHTCTLVDRGAKCWGSAYYGQLGNGVKGYFATPASVLTAAPATTQVPALSTFAITVLASALGVGGVILLRGRAQRGGL